MCGPVLQAASGLWQPPACGCGHVKLVVTFSRTGGSQ